MIDYIDFHCHILPNFDDGPSSCAESAQMLRTLYADGVRTVVSTSHFYRHNETIADFIRRRKSAYDRLCSYLAESGIEDIPQIVLGAEVYFTPALRSDPDLELLCIGNSSCMLLELPYEPLNSTVTGEYMSLLSANRVKPVFAHIERYLRFADKKRIYELLKTGTPAQINCDSLLSLLSAGFPMRLIKEGYIAAIGTDAHNMTSRQPRFAAGARAIQKKLGREALSEIMHSAQSIIS